MENLIEYIKLRIRNKQQTRVAGAPNRALMSAATVVMIAGLAAPAVSANTQLTLVEDDAWAGDGLGGPFGVLLDASGEMVHPGAGHFGADDGHFISFCMERREHIRQGGTYDVKINPHTAGRFAEDPLDDRTAFLYTRFSEGRLNSAFNAWAEGSNLRFEYMNADDGEALQEAIWMIEDESGFELASPELTNALIAFADEAVAEGGAWFGMDIGRVRIMNLTENGESRQDMLTIIPLPAPVLLGLGGLGLAACARRRLIRPDV